MLLHLIRLFLLNERGEINLGDGAPAAEAVPGEAAVVQEEAAPGEVSVTYPEGFDPELKGNAAFKSFIDVEGKINHANLMKSYVHQQKLLGGDKMPVPTDTFTDDQWNETYKKLGLPERDKYTVKHELPEGVDANEEFFTGLVDTLHSSGVLPQQAQKIMDYYTSTVSSHVTESQTTSAAALEADEAALKQEWGEAFDSKVAIAQQAISEFASEEDMAKLEKAGVLGNTTLFKIFAKAGENMLSEDTKFNDKAQHNIGLTPEDAMKRRTALYDDKAFLNKNHPDHNIKLAEFAKLNKIIVG